LEALEARTTAGGDRRYDLIRFVPSLIHLMMEIVNNSHQSVAN
jgi:hypothetical protein